MKQTDEQLKIVHFVHQFVKRKKLLNNGEKIIVAVSGGIDSVVLLDILLHLQRMNDLHLVVAHVNYRLRGKDSDKDEQFVRRLADQHGLPCYIYSVDTKKIQADEKGTLQETARNIRYSFFETLKKSLHAGRIATGHTASDNAETVLFHLFRGSGIDGIAGIPLRRDDVIRPLLCLSRKEIEQYAAARKIGFREDSSNSTTDYSRNYIRHDIIPKIERRLNPSLVRTLSDESEIFAAHAQFINRTVEMKFSGIVRVDTNRFSISVEKISGEDPFIQQMILRKIFSLAGTEPHHAMISSVLSLIRLQKGKQIHTGDGWTAERLHSDILMTRETVPEKFSIVMPREGTISTSDFVFSITLSRMPDNKRRNHPSISHTEYVDAAKISFPLQVRSWNDGDAFIPLGMKGKKKVSDFFSDAKLSRNEKQSVPIIECSNKIVWIAGYRLDDRFKIGPSTTGVYQLTLTRLHGKENHRR